MSRALLLCLKEYDIICLVILQEMENHHEI